MYGFDVKKVKSDVINWIRDWFENNGKDCNAVIGISGGKDSAAVAALCAEALGKERVIGVTMPNGIQYDIEDSDRIIEILGIRKINFNINPAYTVILDALKTSIDVTSLTKLNLAPRLRMSVLYAVSQSMNGRVANTCNLSEDYVGYSTRWGDSAGDFSPLANLTSDEVSALGLECGLPEKFACKTPSDGLCGKSDEDNLGFTYKTLNKYIRTGECDDVNIKLAIDKRHTENLFKMKLIPSFPYLSEYNEQLSETASRTFPEMK